MDWKQKYGDKVVTADEAVKAVRSGDKVVVGLGLHPKSLCNALAKRKDELRNVTVLSHWLSHFPWFDSGWEDSFNVQTAFVVVPTRKGHAERRFDYVPSILGMSNGERQRQPMRGSIYPNADVFLAKVTPPDNDGWCSFGSQVWNGPVAARTAKTVLAEVDSSLPWTYGERIHVSKLDCLVEFPHLAEEQLAHLPLPPQDEADAAQVIGANAAGLVKDGDTLQVGVGTASEGIRDFLSTRNDLGLDSEVMCTWMLDLIKAGVVNGKKKNRERAKHVLSAFTPYPGDPDVSEALAYLDHNPDFVFRDVSYVCHIPRIAANRNQVALNNALAIDLTGQAVVTHLGGNPIAGPGGQLEFTIGAQYSRGGRSITCLMTTAKGGSVSRIVPQFEAGAIVLIPNVYLDYLVTEYGIVNLNGKSMRQRAEAIISVAHPDFRPELMKAARKMFWP